MKKMYQLFFVFLLAAFMFSCEQKVKTADNQSPTNHSETILGFENHENFLKKEEIETNIQPERFVKSLLWEKQTEKYGSQFVQVEGFYNNENQLVKIIEHFADGNFQPHGKRIYYLEDNKIIFFEEGADVWSDSVTSQYIEKRTLFENDLPSLSQMRYAPWYEDIIDSVWTNIPTENPSLTKVNHILSGTNEFETHFISVIKSEQLFLLIGEAKPQTQERYTTAVLVPEITPFIDDLLTHIEEYKFRPINIGFEIIGGSHNEPEFSVLTAIEWKE